MDLHRIGQRSTAEDSTQKLFPERRGRTRCDELFNFIRVEFDGRHVVELEDESAAADEGFDEFGVVECDGAGADLDVGVDECGFEEVFPFLGVSGVIWWVLLV